MVWRGATPASGGARGGGSPARRAYPTTNATGGTVTRQVFDAWGKRLSGSVSATDRSYTGQYLDDTGLLFYNARYYDPGIGRFVSADSIAPKREMPQTRNRYSYVTNNPLAYTDPTGHCNVRGNDGDDLNECKARLADLSQYGITIVDFSSGLWSLLELVAFVQAVSDLQAAMHWSMDEFRNNIGAVHARQSQEKLGKALVGTDASALSTPSGKGYTDMVFYQDSISGVDKGNTTFFLTTVVHELAHAWDFNRGGAMSLGMMSATKSYYTTQVDQNGTIHLKYVAKGITTDYAKNNHAEDWAEAVAAYVYDQSLIDSNRINYVKNPGGGGGGSGGKR